MIPHRLLFQAALMACLASACTIVNESDDDATEDGGAKPSTESPSEGDAGNGPSEVSDVSDDEGTDLDGSDTGSEPREDDAGDGTGTSSAPTSEGDSDAGVRRPPSIAPPGLCC